MLDELLDASPAAHARTPSRDPNAVEVKDGPPPWTRDQTVRFLDEVDDHRWRALWHVAIKTGARRGALLGLRSKDVDLGTAQVTIRRALSVVHGTAHLLGTKTAQSRVLSIGASVVHALECRRRAQEEHRSAAGEDWSNQWGLVFTSPTGRYIRPDTVTAHFRQLVQTLELPVIRLHALRHTNASLLQTRRVAADASFDTSGNAVVAVP